MDYNRLLFAFHVRELAMQRLVKRTPEGLTAEAEREWRFERSDAVIAEVVAELSSVAARIDKAVAELP